MTRRPFNPAGQTAVHPLLPQAVSLHQTGRLADAGKLYEKILTQVPRHFDATHLLGVIALQEGRLDVAERLIGAALTIKPNDAPALNNRGTVRLRQGNLSSALTDFERAAKIQPNFIDAQSNLGTVLQRLQRPRDALIPLRRALSANPRSVLLCNLLGACLLDIGDSAGAVSMFETITQIDPNDAGGWTNLAVALNVQGERQRARDCAEKAVALEPNSSNALAAVATIELDVGKVDAAIATFQRAVTLANPSAQTCAAFANALLTAGRFDEAIAQLSRAVALDGSNASARWKLATAQCKPVYRSAEELAASRRSFAERLAELTAWHDAAKDRDAYTAVGSDQPFYLAYHPCDNLELLSAYGDVCVQWMAPVARGQLARAKPQKKPKESPSMERFKVGIVAAHVSDHSVWNAITKGWIEHLDKTRFEIHLFHLGKSGDQETARARTIVARFVDTPDSLSAWVKAIQDPALDVLIYPEIGMDHLTTQLAALRLAPLQAITWGHPQTSGLPTQDLYLSAALLEPPGGQKDYREKLVSLANLGVYVEPLSPPIAIPNLRSLGLPSDEPLLLCPGTPYKYSPVHDPLWIQIARGLHARRSGRLVFFRGRSKPMDDLFEQRLRAAFARAGADFDARVTVIKALERPLFYGLMQQSTLMLDTLNFSGFNTVMQAIEVGLPMLCFEGEFMRGRLASGVMRRLDLPELIATAEADYVEKALRLAFDATKTQRLRQEIGARRSALFHDAEPIRSLERCLSDEIRASRSRV